MKKQGEDWATTFRTWLGLGSFAGWVALCALYGFDRDWLVKNMNWQLAFTIVGLQVGITIPIWLVWWYVHKVRPAEHRRLITKKIKDKYPKGFPCRNAIFRLKSEGNLDPRNGFVLGEVRCRKCGAPPIVAGTEVLCADCGEKITGSPLSALKKDCQEEYQKAVDVLLGRNSDA